MRVTPRSLDILGRGPPVCGDLAVSLSQASPQFTQVGYGLCVKFFSMFYEFFFLVSEFVVNKIRYCGVATQSKLSVFLLLCLF